jgi:hypothetical protein
MFPILSLERTVIEHQKNLRTACVYHNTKM